MRIVGLFTSNKHFALNSSFHSLETFAPIPKCVVEIVAVIVFIVLNSWHSIVDKQKAFNLMSAFYRVICEVVLMIEIKWLMEKFNQDPLLCYITLPDPHVASAHPIISISSFLMAFIMYFV